MRLERRIVSRGPMQFMIKAHAFHAFVTAEISNFMGLSQLPGKKIYFKTRQIMQRLPDNY